MIEEKEIPSEYVSIRHIWLKGIEDCRRAISQRVISEASEIKLDLDAGDRTIVHTVHALYLSLVDHGEAVIRSEVDEWYNSVYRVKNQKIWEELENTKFSSVGSKTNFIHECWRKNAFLSEKFYDMIIKTLNKYNMLFPEQPAGYSNVIMEEIEE